MTGNVLAILEEWQSTVQPMDAALEELARIVGREPEAPLMAAAHALQGLATRQAAALIGTTPDWLEAWWLEHGFGERPMRAGLVGEPLREIATPEDLAALMTADLAASERENGHG